METDLKAAIETIQETARLGDKASIHHFGTSTPNEGKIEFPVAFVADGPGKVRMVSVVEEMAKAAKVAKEARLAQAAGPDRRTGTAVHHTLGSFLQHVDRFKDEGTAIWIDQNVKHPSGKAVTCLRAIFNYHRPMAGGTPRWGDHRAIYDIHTSQAWDDWGAGEPKEFGADGFAEFLEAHDFQLTTGILNGGNAPPPAFLLSMADKLEVYSSNNARKERDPQTNRTRLTFVEEKGATVGDVAPPPAFLIRIKVFEDSAEAIEVEVRLRVTVQDKKACFKIWIHNAQTLLQKELARLRDEVVNASKVPVFSGVAE